MADAMDSPLPKRKRRYAAALLAVVAVLACAISACGQSSPSNSVGSPSASTPRKTPLVMPSYEPIQYNGKDSLTPAQKALYKEILDFALADMERRHVSAGRINQFQWQMHFYVPVHYKPDHAQACRLMAHMPRGATT